MLRVAFGTLAPGRYSVNTIQNCRLPHEEVAAVPVPARADLRPSRMRDDAPVSSWSEIVGWMYADKQARRGFRQARALGTLWRSVSPAPRRRTRAALAQHAHAAEPPQFADDWSNVPSRAAIRSLSPAAGRNPGRPDIAGDAKAGAVCACFLGRSATGCDRPSADHLVAAHCHHLVVQIGHHAAMIGNDTHALARYRTAPALR